MKSNKFLISLLVVLVILLSVVCISYSYFTAKVTENNKTETDIKVSNLELQFNGVTEITADGILLGESFTKTFNVVNDTNNELTYNIYMENITNTIGKDLVYSLKDDSKEIVTEKSMPSTADKKYLLKKLTISGNTTVNYTMTVTLLNKEDEDQSDLMGKSFKGTLGIDTLQVPTAVAVLKASNEAMPSTTLNFSQSSIDSNGNGLYILTSTKNDAYPIYFYRGNISNNNLKFAGFCWKIVRTTSTGGIKIVYNGNPDENGYCSNTTGENTVLSYGIYGQSTSYKSSTGVNSNVKGTIDTWYYSNIIKYQSFLEDTIYCNDRTSTFESRLSSNDEPLLTCSNDDSFTVSDENGNGLLDYPIALLSADEMKLAGFSSNNSTHSYLYNALNNWTMTQAKSSSYVIYTNNQYLYVNGNTTGGYAGGVENTSYAIRPVVSLNRNVELGGTGTSDDPYVIIE